MNGIILVNYVVRCVGRRRNRKLVQKGKLEDVRMSFTELIFVASLPVLRRAAIKRDDVQRDCVIAFVLFQLHEIQVVTVFVGDCQRVCAVTHFELCRLVATQLHVVEVHIVDPRDSASVFGFALKASTSSFISLTQLFCVRSAVSRRLQLDCTRCSA